VTPKSSIVKRIFTLVLLISACSPKVQLPDPEALKPSWLKNQPYQDGYYTGIGHSPKQGSNNYIQSAKKSAMDDLISQIKVNVSSTSVLNVLEVDQKLKEQYEQIIQTTAADDIEEFELVDAYEDPSNYWVYYRLSIARYRQIKEEQKRNATLLATDYLKKAREAANRGEQLQSLTFYFQAFRSIEKYLGEAIRIQIDNQDLLLVNEIYGSIQAALDKIKLTVKPAEILLNRRVAQSQHEVIVQALFPNSIKTASNLPLIASFEKGSGDVHPLYKTDEAGKAKILISKITSKELEQSLVINLDIDALSGTAGSPIYALIVKTFNVPRAQVNLSVQRPIVFLTSEEKSLGAEKPTAQLSNKIKNLLSSNGFEFTNEKSAADLWLDVKSDAEKGSVSGSIYLTYLTSVIKVVSVKEGKEIFATTLDRIKGYGLDYDKSSVDAYNKALVTLEKEKVPELLNSVLQ
jgi:hypothetical protein